MNALEWNRDLTLPVAAIRQREKGLTDKLDRARGTVSLPELRKAGIGLVVATQIARYVENGSQLPGWNSPYQAWAQTQGQLAWYKAMEEAGEMVMIRDAAALEGHLALWNATGPVADVGGATAPEDLHPTPPKNPQPVPPGNPLPVGYILSLEGADSLIDLSYLEKAYRGGLRAIGPAHYGPGRYAPGTGMTGPFTKQGIALLKEMDRLNMILDVTHLTDEAFRQAMDIYKGNIWASHHNCRALVQHQRQLSDEQIRMLIERGSVIGGVLDAWMLCNGWVRGESDPRQSGAGLEKLVDHYDHICQIAGNTDHIAIGSDLDGMFGKEQSPYDLETIADLQGLGPLLQKRGYSQKDIGKLFHGNWLRFLRKAWE